jgi:hypothetical protein
MEWWESRLACQLRDLDALEGQGNALLARLLPKALGKRGRHVAMDLIALPSHGTVAEAQQDEVCRSKAPCGTTHFCPDATASAVVQGRRYTLAICRVRAKQRITSCEPSLSAWRAWRYACTSCCSTGVCTAYG